MTRIAWFWTASMMIAVAASAAPEADRRDEKQKKPKETKQAVRTLEEITIEGEIDVPQVLFITARKQKRYRDRNYRLYLKTARALASETAYPMQLRSRVRPQP